MGTRLIHGLFAASHHPLWHALRIATTAMALVALLGIPALAQFAEPEVRVLATLGAETPGDNFGWVAESIGDIDGDGAADFLIGAPFRDEGGINSGKAFVYSGRDATLVNTIVGGPFERVGFSVSGGQDIDKDGVNDYVVGAAPVFGFGITARVIAVSGTDHSIIFEAAGEPDTLFAYDVNLAGDVDGDGHADVIVGAPLASSPAGRIDLLSGRDGTVIWSRVGQPGDLLGVSVTGLGDLNGDGIPEQAAGALGAGQVTGPNQESVGAAYVLDGKTAVIIHELTPNGTGFRFGDFFSHDAGDVDGDGLSDIYVGDFGDSRGGRGYVFSGADGERLRLFNAEATSDRLGMGRGAGDVDGDGRDDLLVGAFLSSAGALRGGKVWVFSGKNGRTIRTFTSTVSNARVGFDVVRLNDVDGDGVTDFLLTGLDIAFVVAGQ